MGNRFYIYGISVESLNKAIDDLNYADLKIMIAEYLYDSFKNSADKKIATIEIIKHFIRRVLQYLKVTYRERPNNVNQDVNLLKNGFHPVDEKTEARLIKQIETCLNIMETKGIIEIDGNVLNDAQALISLGPKALSGCDKTIWLAATELDLEMQTTDVSNVVEPEEKIQTSTTQEFGSPLKRKRKVKLESPLAFEEGDTEKNIFITHVNPIKEEEVELDPLPHNEKKQRHVTRTPLGLFSVEKEEILIKMELKDVSFAEIKERMEKDMINLRINQDAAMNNCGYLTEFCIKELQYLARGEEPKPYEVSSDASYDVTPHLVEFDDYNNIAKVYAEIADKGLHSMLPPNEITESHHEGILRRFDLEDNLVEKTYLPLDQLKYKLMNEAIKAYAIIIGSVSFSAKKGSRGHAIAFCASPTDVFYVDGHLYNADKRNSPVFEDFDCAYNDKKRISFKLDYCSYLIFSQVSLDRINLIEAKHTGRRL